MVRQQPAPVDFSRKLSNRHHNRAMKQLPPVCLILLLCSSFASAATVKITVTLSTAPEDKPVTAFTADTPKIYAIFKTEGVSPGTKIKAVLVAEDVGDAAPANTAVLDKTLDLNEDTTDGAFNFSKPNNGWPPGKYRVEFYANDTLATKAAFTIEGEKRTGSSKQAGATEPVPDKNELRAMTDASITTFGEAIKDKDFSGFYLDVAEVWQKQTTAEKLEEIFKDFYDKDIDLPAAIEGKEPVFDESAAINSDGVLVVQGHYPTAPNRIVFELKYVKEEDEWKLAGIKVNLKK
jgi:hypothetical protein